MTWNEKLQAVADAAKQFPREFGLRAFPGDVFSISQSASYVNDSGQIQLYTVILRNGRWESFCKGTPAELQSQITPRPVNQ